MPSIRNPPSAMPLGGKPVSPIARQIGAIGEEPPTFELQKPLLVSSDRGPAMDTENLRNISTVTTTSAAIMPMSPGLHAAHLLKTMASGLIFNSMPPLPLSHAAGNDNQGGNDSKLEARISSRSEPE